MAGEAAREAKRVRKWDWVPENGAAACGRRMPAGKAGMAGWKPTPRDRDT